MDNDVSNSRITMDDGTNPGKKTKGSKTPKELSDAEAYKFVEDKKKLMKENPYRQRFDALCQEIDNNLVNTEVSYGGKLYEKQGWGSMITYNKLNNGSYDINVYPTKVNNRDQNQSGVPNSQQPIAFSKILIATSVLAGKIPDAQVISDDAIYGKSAYELWKRTWILKGGNGQNTLARSYQNNLTYGWVAWRTYPRKVVTKRKGVEKILFDDIYREPMDPKRTWLGLGVNVGDYWSQFEVYYEKDMPKDQFFDLVPGAKDFKGRKNFLEKCGVSDEAKEENDLKSQHSYTIGYYENVLLNRYVVKCGKFIIFDGELPNDDNYGSILVAQCFVRDILDPYGVGLYELMRGNSAMYTYINSLNAQQVEAEISPLLFGVQTQNGSNVYKRGPNVINPRSPGSKIDVVNTSGNVQQGIAYANQQKIDIEENTGVNNIVAGQNAESTLGSTVILKEAAYNRLTPPKNSMMNALQTDAHIAFSWIEQTYTVDKIFMIDTNENVAEFARQNPDYYIQSQEITDDVTGEVTGMIVAASKNLRLDFDFTQDGRLLEDVPTRVISQKGLFDQMKENGHGKSYIEFIIDPDSMLVPSMEIQKQTAMALFPVVTNQLNQIFSLRLSDPEAASSQLMALEQLLKTQKESIFDYIKKEQYDAIMNMQPSPIAPPSAEEPLDKTSIYKYAPSDVQRQIEEQAGLQPSQSNNLPPQTPGTIPTEKRQNPQQPGVSADRNAGRPKSANQVPRPQSPLGASTDASLGRAAKLPFFPG